MIYLTDFLPEQTKDFHLHLMAPFNQVLNLALHRHSHAGNACQQLADPTEGRPLRGLDFKRLFTISEYYDRDRGAF